MKELLFILIMSMVLLIVVCEQPEREYSTEEAREALDAGEEDLYSILVDIQNTWEVIITKQDLV